MTDTKNDDTTTDEVEVEATEIEKLDARSDEAIVASRSADIDTEEAKDGEHVKIFVLPPGPKPTEANGFNHEANFAAVRQYMLSQGLRPTGDVRHVSTKPHLGNEARGWALKYAVPAVPAERFDFAEVHVITENEDPDGDGHVTGESGNKPAETDAEAEAKAAKSKADAAAKKAASDKQTSK